MKWMNIANMVSFCGAIVFVALTCIGIYVLYVFMIGGHSSDYIKGISIATITSFIMVWAMFFVHKWIKHKIAIIKK